MELRHCELNGFPSRFKVEEERDKLSLPLIDEFWRQMLEVDSA
jgi:hypothetical protein